jgi:hypothetical protein
MNGICRSFPQSILQLLEGDKTTADNRLCTTLFCISSALKKLSQCTPLPQSWYVLPRYCVLWECRVYAAVPAKRCQAKLCVCVGGGVLKESTEAEIEMV